MSEYEKDLGYPIKVGHSWQSYSAHKKITAVNKTIATPYKTFTNAVEVTGDEGFKTYYVKNIGFVKSVDKNGRTLTELVDIQ